MIVSEKQAREKWCPEARVVFCDVDSEGKKFTLRNNNSSSNRIRNSSTARTHDQTYCIASDCMFWRWAIGDGWGKTTNVQTHGYCGKAGKP